MSSREARHAERQRLAGIAQAHAIVPEVAAKAAERSLAVVEQSLASVYATPRRQIAPAYTATPYGKYWGSRESEKLERSAAIRAENQRIWLQGGFVSEAQYVSYVKGLYRTFTDAAYDAFAERKVSAIHRFTDAWTVGTLIEALWFYRSKATLKWGREKADGLTYRAEQIAAWYAEHIDYKPVKDDGECDNDKHPLIALIAKGNVMRRKCDTVTGQTAYLEWLTTASNYDAQWIIARDDVIRTVNAAFENESTERFNEKLAGLFGVGHYDDIPEHAGFIGPKRPSAYQPKPIMPSQYRTVAGMAETVNPSTKDSPDLPQYQDTRLIPTKNPLGGEIIPINPGPRDEKRFLYETKSRKDQRYIPADASGEWIDAPEGTGIGAIGKK